MLKELALLDIISEMNVTNENKILGMRILKVQTIHIHNIHKVGNKLPTFRPYIAAVTDSENIRKLHFSM